MQTSLDIVNSVVWQGFGLNEAMNLLVKYIGHMR